jgi:hypothetical protein
LGRHRKIPTDKQAKAANDIMNNNILFKECKGMNAQELKKELRKRKLDSSYNGSKRELIQRIEKFVKDDNKKKQLIVRGDWIQEVEMKYLEVLGNLAIFFFFCSEKQQFLIFLILIFLF